MSIKRKILGLTATTALSLFALNAATAETITVTSKADVNAAADSMVVERTTYSYDANNNGFIEPGEFTTYVTKRVDLDGDGYLESSEYTTDSMVYFYNHMSDTQKTESNVTNYTYWDKDKDNRLDSSEVETLVANTGFYKTWDKNKDGKIDSAEFAAGTFASYDDNNDGKITINEWADVTM